MVYLLIPVRLNEKVCPNTTLLFMNHTKYIIYSGSKKNISYQPIDMNRIKFKQPNWPELLPTVNSFFKFVYAEKLISICKNNGSPDNRSKNKVRKY